MTRSVALLGLTLLLTACCWSVSGQGFAQETPATPAAEAAATPAPAAAETPAAPAEATPEAAAPVTPPHLAGTYDTGSITWLLISSALVFFMMPGLALFYGGMVRSKNVLNMFMLVLVCVPIVAVQWVGWGYSIAFAVPSAFPIDAGMKDDGKTEKPKLSLLGWDQNLVFFKGFSSADPTSADFYGKIVTTGDTENAVPSGVPELLFAMFQMMFAIITPALIVGAIAERVKFSSWCLFVILWATLVYDPVAHWVWNVNGFLFQWGVMDFAGGTVVHVLAGVSALALILILPKRQGFGTSAILPHSVGWTLLGAAFLMVGWFGFNAGSAIAVGASYLPVSGFVAVLAFATTAIAGSAGAGSWMLIEWLHVKKPTALGVGSGMVAGLVAITPCAGHVSPAGALIVGLAGGVVCYLAVQLKHVLRYDDSLDVVGVHGVGGALGALMVGYFAIRPADGSFELVLLQAKGIAISGAYAFVVTLILGLIIHYTIGFTVKEQAQEEGLDFAEHGETAYRL
ncbi:Ammonia channel precursor [Planctopirus ephydatiae]|uniref:Ammonia channel n=1 Tax=Planctopirus ephydatiae TaxID=2528019 RepID=A0A518GP81_9PLAN|nr:ammonium transporter [Planctopirus ephydatiae]QDV30407.1 Ammonia channel precursor [Planctopirus ephydatiae]